MQPLINNNSWAVRGQLKARLRSWAVWVDRPQPDPDHRLPASVLDALILALNYIVEKMLFVRNPQIPSIQNTQIYKINIHTMQTIFSK